MAHMLDHTYSGMILSSGAPQCSFRVKAPGSRQTCSSEGMLIISTGSSFSFSGVGLVCGIGRLSLQARFWFRQVGFHFSFVEDLAVTGLFAGAGKLFLLLNRGILHTRLAWLSVQRFAAVVRHTGFAVPGSFELYFPYRLIRQRGRNPLK